jgi:2-haloacid dehalogenase
MYKAVIFDLGGVLFTNGTRKFIDVISQRYNLPLEKVRKVMEEDIGTQYREGKITRDDFWKKVQDQLRITEDSNTLEDEWISGYELIDGTKDIIDELSKTYPIYYLSDNVRERIEKINAKFSFLQWFKGGVFSHEEGIRKPHPEIYKIALQKVGVAANEAVFIDDKAPFLVPAKELGMATIHFTSPQQLRNDLKQLGLLSS